MTEIYISVQGMESQACIKAVTKVIQALQDVQSIHVDIQSGRIEVSRTVNKSDDLIHALNAAGYPSSLDLDEQ
ncbi:heavy metal-associated domain-containing protein [Polynucleobacter sp. MG-28-Ekke-A2]|uniref:heavy-metal-associated domain-containing protein n=1 Tax=Polynucleobacter sp. MG-28-Ekke-A2 TaxID=3108276 RepID=UPI002B22B9D0|nr:heavy metal-associated domain-containing protein [Polynucleobacter sp. MG-28-Ekke-A2]MEA9602254.1 heavy metal-associated domain-containing protein [Polynucleobacter sp. MG-28-Ekke-A2]